MPAVLALIVPAWIAEIEAWRGEAQGGESRPGPSWSRAMERVQELPGLARANESLEASLGNVLRGC